MNQTYWYVATPYSKFPDGAEAAYHSACLAAGSLIARGLKVFCPIAHSHPIAECSSLPLDDYDIWLPLDEPFMEAAHGLIVVKMQGWRTSHGVTHEIAHFKAKGKPVMYLDWPGGDN